MPLLPHLPTLFLPTRGEFGSLLQRRKAGQQDVIEMGSFVEKAGSAPKPLAAVQDQPVEDSFIKTRPLTISAAARMRIAVIASPKTMMPTTNAPTAPMPVQIV